MFSRSSRGSGIQRINSRSGALLRERAFGVPGLDLELDGRERLAPDADDFILKLMESVGNGRVEQKIGRRKSLRDGDGEGMEVG